MKKVLRYEMDDLLKYVQSNQSVIDLGTDEHVHCDTVFEMDDNTYRVLIDGILYDAFFSDDDVIFTREDPIYLGELGISDIETRAKYYNRRLYLADEQYGYINAIYFLGEIESVDEVTIEESHQKVLREFDESEKELSTLEMCERLQESYEKVNSTVIPIFD